MRLEYKIAIGIGVFVIVAGIAALSSRDADDAREGTGIPLADRTGEPEETSPVASGEDTESASPDEAQPLPDQNVGWVASPQPEGLGEPADESPRRGPLESPTPDTTSERTGLTDVSLGGESEEDTAAEESTTPETDLPELTTPTPEPPVTVAPPRSGLEGEDASAETPLTDATADRAEPEPAAMTEHAIRPGDTFSKLALEYLGHVKYANLISKANPEVDPRRLHVGKKVNIPARPVEVAAPTPAADRTPTARASSLPPIPEGRSYRVEPGESWSSLAQRFLGDANDWPELYELNKERVSGNRNLLRAGTVIELPARAATATSTNR